MNKLEINNFKSFSAPQIIDFDNKNFLLYGDNGAGKSSMFEAIKICFFKDKLQPKNDDEKTPEENRQIVSDFWSQYNNKNASQDFELKINDTNFNDFDSKQYSVFMINTDSTCNYEYIRLDLLLERNFLTDEPQQFCKDNWKSLQDNINKILTDDFHEDIQIDIDAEDDFKIRIKNDKRNISFIKENISKYFNEARINLLVLLLVFESIKLIEKKDKNILVLDDFITSLDVANRTSIIKYIFDNFKEFQIIIFTHNVFFYNLISYMINEYYKSDDILNKDKWQFANLYEIENRHNLYIKGMIQEVKELKNEFKSSNVDLQDIGNKIRQKFEVLLFELSKLLVVGATEESKDVISKIEQGKSLYLKDKVLDDILAILNDTNENSLKQRLITKINEHKSDGYQDIQKIVRDLKLYQKIILHPMSHGVNGQSSYTTAELSQSLELLEKLESNINKLASKKVDGA